jgi:hypothetical protein
MYTRRQSVEPAHGTQCGRDQLAIELRARDTAPRSHTLRHALCDKKHSVAYTLCFSDTSGGNTPDIMCLNDVIHPLRTIHVYIYRISHIFFLFSANITIELIENGTISPVKYNFRRKSLAVRKKMPTFASFK